MEIILTRDNLRNAGLAEAGAEDRISTRARKLIPGEVAALYTALITLVPPVSADQTAVFAPLVAIGVCTVVIVFWIGWDGRTVRSKPIAAHPTQYIVSVLAFWAWCFSIQNPIEGFGRYVPKWISAFALVLLPIFGAFILRDGSDQ